jgi:hypothetical protein
LEVDGGASIGHDEMITQGVLSIYLANWNGIIELSAKSDFVNFSWRGA